MMLCESVGKHYTAHHICCSYRSLQHEGLYKAVIHEDPKALVDSLQKWRLSVRWLLASTHR